jgi:hypothetical protein
MRVIAVVGRAFNLGNRSIGLALIPALVALGALTLAPVAAARKAHPISTYLALGDSISFGYSEQVFDENEPNDAPAYFEEGFTDAFAEDLGRGREVGRNLVLVNDGCPGETSNGLIGENRRGTTRRGSATTTPARTTTSTACRCTTR